MSGLFGERVSDFNSEWVFYPGKFDLFHSQDKNNKGYRTVNIPHDFMIEKDVDENAASGPAMGFYEGGLGNYTKKFNVPSECENKIIYVYFDGIMGHASIDVNGAFVMTHHYGYTPFFADITPYVDYDAQNRITVNVNASMQPSSRWYSGAGIYREVRLMCVPRLHIKPDGIYVHTDRISYKDGKADKAYITAEVTVRNCTCKRRIAGVQVTATCIKDGSNTVTRKGSICIEPDSENTARIRMTVDNPYLWDDINPDLYNVEASVTDMGVFTTHMAPRQDDEPFNDSDSVIFGIRTITVDSSEGLLVNGRQVKLRGGCIHHDNGVIGAVSLYDSEYRKMLIHKEGGYNAIRSAHNPPSSALLLACDRLGIYVVDEAFDCFETAKQPGDYSQFFRECWRDDIKAFVMRDRSHPSVIIWSTGNEIPERGGLGNGYVLAGKLADYMRSLDSTRPVTNAFCSFWSGLCDSEQNDNPQDKDPEFMERRSEPFVNNLDLVGYNYLDDKYDETVKHYPERVIVGTESFPRFSDTIWENVMKHPAVIGDFVWTSYDYIGEAGLGKSCFHEKGNEEAEKEAERLIGTFESPYPWRLAKDSDYDINGDMLPQGGFRRVVWGSGKTYVYAADPAYYDMEEVISYWGFSYVYPNWNYPGYEGKPVKVQVYSRAPEVILLLNGEEAGRKKCGLETHYTAEFDIVYRPGTLTAVSVDESGREISRDSLVTTGKAVRIEAVSDRSKLKADGKSLGYVSIKLVDSKGSNVFGEDVKMSVTIEGAACIQGFGSANPVTDENYTAGRFTSYHGRCLAVVRSGYETGSAVLTVSAEGYDDVQVEFEVV